MAGSGWPKGKKRGPLSEAHKAAIRQGKGPLTAEHKKKLQAGRVRAGHKRKLREAEMASGFDLGQTPFAKDRSQSLVDISRAAWLSRSTHVGDCEYIEYELDDVYMRALHDRVVYAGSTCCHHETPLQEITIDLIAAVDRVARKNGKKPRTGLPKPLRPVRPAVKIRKITPAVVVPVPIEREGSSLHDVVEELFSREGRPLLEVVSELLDS